MRLLSPLNGRVMDSRPSGCIFDTKQQQFAVLSTRRKGALPVAPDGERESARVAGNSVATRA